MFTSKHFIVAVIEVTATSEDSERTAERNARSIADRKAGALAEFLSNADITLGETARVALDRATFQAGQI